MAQINIHEDMIKCALHLKIESTITSKTVKAKLLELRVFFVFFVRVVTPQNVILTQNVIRIAAKCNTNAKCNDIDAKCNKIFNAKCNNHSTQIVITFLTHNVITQNVIISKITTCMLFQNRYCGSVISS